MRYYDLLFVYTILLLLLLLLSPITRITTIHGLQIPTSTSTTSSSSSYMTTLTARMSTSTGTSTKRLATFTSRPSSNSNKLLRINAQLIHDPEDPIPWYKQHTQQSSSSSSSSNTHDNIVWNSIRNTLSSSSSSTSTSSVSTQQQQQQRSFTDTSSFLSFLSSLSLPTTTTTPTQQQQQQIISSSSSSSKGSMIEMIVSLVKAIVGGGVLTIPASVTTLGDAPQQVLPIATLLIIIIGTINAYYFSIMGQVCNFTNATTFTQAWERTMCTSSSTTRSSTSSDTNTNNVVSSSSSSSLLFSGMICIKTILSCIAYSMIIGESFQSLAMSAGLMDLSTSNTLVFITCFALLPLCLMKNVSSLAPFSLAGIIGFAYTAGVMTLRAQDGSYHLAPIDTIESGKYLIDLQDPYKPNFGHTGPELQGIVLACTLATAFVSHYNAPRFHNELQNKQQFDTVTYTSFGIAATIMSIIAIAGFTTFGIASAPVILNNYSPYDPLIAAGRTAIAASLVATFPFPFFGLRDSILDIINKNKNTNQEQQQLLRKDSTSSNDNTNDDEINNVLLTVGLLTIITGAALTINDLSLLMSVGGGTIATMVYSVFPTLMYRAAISNQIQSLQQQKQQRSNDDEIIAFQQKHQFDINLSTSLMVVCVITGATGVGLALQNHFVH
jgi:amino acid permease